MNVGAIILAAGRSSRFDAGHKLLADAGGGPLIARVVTAVAASKAADLVLVTAPEGGRIVAAAGPGRWRAIVNEDAGGGLSSSIRTGVAALASDTSGALVVLADMPGVSSPLISKLIAAFEASGGEAIVYPVSADGRQGHPVLWPCALFGELMALSGDKGGKALIDAHHDLARPVQVDGDGAFLDIDTTADLEAYKATRP